MRRGHGEDFVCAVRATVANHGHFLRRLERVQALSINYLSLPSQGASVTCHEPRKSRPEQPVKRRERTGASCATRGWIESRSIDGSLPQTAGRQLDGTLS